MSNATVGNAGAPAAPAPRDLLRWMSAIDELAMAVNQQRDLPDLLQRVARTACELLGYEGAAVLLCDDEQRALRIRGSWGLSDEYVTIINERTPLLVKPKDSNAGSPSTRAFVEGVPVIVDDIAEDASYQPWAKAAQAQGHRSMGSVPLHNQGATVGTLNVYGHIPRQLGPSGLELLQVLASHAGIALETSAQLDRDRRRLEELSRLNEALRHQTELLRQHAAIHDRFIGVARQGGGVGGVASALSETADRAVVVEDVWGKTLASVTRAGVSVTPPDWQSWPGDEAQPELLEMLSSAGLVETSDRFPGLLAGPIRVGDEILGILWLAGASEVEELQLRAVEQATVVLGMEMLRRRAVADAQWQLRGDLVSELIRGATTDTASLLARGDRLGSDLRLPQTVIVARPCEDDDAATTQLLRTVQALVSSLPRPKPLMALRGKLVVVVAPASQPQAGDVLAERIRSAGGRALPGIVRVAISDLATSLDRLRAAFRAAHGLLRLVPHAPDERVLTVSAAGMVGLLLSDVDPRHMGSLATRWIAPLREYDQDRNTELVATLRAYLTHDLNTNATAAALYIHPNTVGLRIKRIESVLGLSLTKVDHLTTLRTALAVDDVIQND
jgi:sugar diacid utilization regulator/GAF domain-containing protein